MIVIVDYGMGNLGSVRNMLDRIGAPARIGSTPDELEGADKLILPGVGAFDHAIRNLQERNLIPTLNRMVLEERIPVLGICLGMQLLTNGSEEGTLPGLGWIPGEAVKFRFPDRTAPMRLPHMGWNTIIRKQSSGLLGVPDPLERFYFVHSFHVQCQDAANLLATSQYGLEFAAAIVKGHILGTQFHPEKSHRYGMGILSRFAQGHHAAS